MNRLDQYDWNRLYRARREADKRLEEAVRRALPSGSECHVRHGDKRRPVTVLEHHYGARLTVVGATGNPYQVNAFRIAGIGDRVSFA